MVVTLAPIPQDPSYHLFADKRSIFGIPNFWDVVSNIPYLGVGLLGARICLRKNTGVAQPAWLILFVGIAMVSGGSAYYHWQPTNSSLVWDRLPMTVGFMGLFTALLGEYIDDRLVKILLIPAVVFGAGTVLYWSLAEDLPFLRVGAIHAAGCRGDVVSIV